MLENYVCKIFVEAITSNHDLLWLITWSISWVGWQIHSLSIHGWFNKINVILVHIWKVFFTLYVTVCTRVMVVNEFWTQRLTVLLFITKVLGTCTWLKKYLMYLMPSKYCEYLYLKILKVLVFDSSTSESTWPQPWSLVSSSCLYKTQPERALAQVCHTRIDALSSDEYQLHLLLHRNSHHSRATYPKWLNH